ncbi:hypothetical protein FRB97_009857 [Tulasnella sp. 331]|nr:hypothetical protein FRB97_009857 [Tulasnella sp. 331]
MLSVADQRSLGILLVPPCAPGNVWVAMHTKNIALVKLEDLSPYVRENSNIPRNDFIGIIVAVGRDIVGHGSKMGNAVAGIARGGWLNTLDGSDQGAVIVEPSAAAG